MNLLELAIKEDAELSGNDFLLDLKIDGEEFLARIDIKDNVASLDELESSISGTGEYLIFTCSCGIADCGGRQKVLVTHDKEEVVWEFEYDDEYYVFEFDAQFYVGEIQRMLFEVNQQKITLYPKHIMYPE